MTMSNSEPLVSIIVPIFNVDKYLHRCIASILHQTYKNIEVLLINDGSTDDSLNIIHQFGEKDKRVVVFDKKNEGYGATCNLGIDRCSGEYFCIVEPDDFIKDNMVEVLLNTATQTNSEVSKAKYIDIFENQERRVIWKGENSIPINKVFYINEAPQLLFYHPSIWTCLYLKEFINREHIRFQNIPGAGWADNLFQIKTLLKARLAFVPIEVYCYRRYAEDPADELKNISFPIDRSKEINIWLEEDRISDRGVLFNIFRRELSYVKIILRSPVCKLQNIERIDNFTKFIKFEFDDIKKLSSEERLIFDAIRNGRLNWLFIKFRLKRTINKFFKIHITRNEQTVRLFGVNFIKNQ